MEYLNKFNKMELDLYNNKNSVMIIKEMREELHKLQLLGQIISKTENITINSKVWSLESIEKKEIRDQYLTLKGEILNLINQLKEIDECLFLNELKKV